MGTIKTTWLVYIVWGVGGYLLLTFLFYFLSDSIIYQPPPRSKGSLPHSVQIPLPNGQHLYGVYLKNPNAKYTILVSNGNATDVARMLGFYQHLEQQGFSVLAYDYRGYGMSGGKPSEKNTYADIRASYNYLTQQVKIDPKHIILMGMSLGTGPTIELGSQEPAAAMILQSPYVSAYRIQTVLPLILFDKYENLKKVSKITMPVLIIQGTDDAIVPMWHAQKIYHALKSPKEAYWVSGADHNDLFNVAGHQYFERVKSFAQSLSQE